MLPKRGYTVNSWFDKETGKVMEILGLLKSTQDPDKEQI